MGVKSKFLTSTNTVPQSDEINIKQYDNELTPVSRAFQDNPPSSVPPSSILQPYFLPPQSSHHISSLHKIFSVKYGNGLTSMILDDEYFAIFL